METVRQQVQHLIEHGRKRDQAYVRGVSQALARAYTHLMNGGTPEDIGLWADEATEMRFARDYHPAFLDEVSRRAQQKRMVS